MSDDEDYMSDKFLQGTEKYVPPSLLYRHSDKRELELMKKKAEIEARLKEKKNAKTIEQEKRDEGLSSAIASSNKGFEMLMKMGYKPGQGIGKTESGIVEPIGVDVKTNRHGLGKAAKKKEKSEPVVNKLNSEKMNDFRSRMAQKKTEQLLKADLHRSQKVCEQLDTQLQIEEPMEPWFWLPKVEANPEEDKPDTDEEESEEEEEEDALPLDEKLEMITRYLRKKHYYCIWCGVAYNDEDDLRDSCPGDTRSDH